MSNTVTVDHLTSQTRRNSPAGRISPTYMLVYWRSRSSGSRTQSWLAASRAWPRSRPRLSCAGSRARGVLPSSRCPCRRGSTSRSWRWLKMKRTGSHNWSRCLGKACRRLSSRSRAGGHIGWLRLSISKDHYMSSTRQRHPDTDTWVYQTKRCSSALALWSRCFQPSRSWLCGRFRGARVGCLC